MSKSLGTGIDPLDVIADHGADATRYGLLKMSSTQDVRFSYGAVEEGRKLANKLWNVSPADPLQRRRRGAELRPRELEERWILARLDATRARWRRISPRFDFSHAVQSLYRVTFDDFCDWYAEAIKPRLYDKDEDAATALAALERLLSAAAPGHAARHRGDLVEPARPRDEADRLAVARAGRRLPATSPALDRVQDAAAIFRRSGVLVELEGDEQRIFSAVVKPERVQANGNEEAERERLRKEIARAEGMLANERFVANAPADVVEGEREKLARYRRELDALGGYPDNVSGWIEVARSPWPEEFGLGRMGTAPARGARRSAGRASSGPVHVVGTNGKTTTTRMCEALLAAEGKTVGAYTSPHVTGWSERIRVSGEPVDLEAALEPRAPAAEAVGATQFEALTAAALAEFAAAGVERPSSRPASAEGSTRPTCSDAPVVVLTNVALEHTDVLGATREEIAREKLAVISPGATAVLGEPEWEELAREAGARPWSYGTSNLALAVAAAESFLGKPVDPAPAEEVVGAGPAGAGGGRAARDLGRRPQPRRESATCSRAFRRAATSSSLSILADKDVDGMLAALSALGETFVATTSSNARALPAGELARKAGRFFDRVEAVADPAEALEQARELGRRRTAPFSSPARSICSPTWPPSDRRLPYHEQRWRAAQRLRARRVRPRGDRGALVWRRVVCWKDPPVTAMQLLAQTTTDSNDLFGGFKDFFDSDVWLVVRNVFFFFLVVFWLASAFWVYKDARRRIEDPWLLAMAVALGIFPPFLGPLLYMFFRPPEYLEEVRERELEIKAMEESLGHGRALPGLPRGRRADLPRLPGLHDEAEGSVPALQGAARAAVAGLPVLRDAGRVTERRRKSLG